MYSSGSWYRNHWRSAALAVLSLCVDFSPILLRQVVENINTVLGRVPSGTSEDNQPPLQHIQNVNVPRLQGLQIPRSLCLGNCPPVGRIDWRVVKSFIDIHAGYHIKGMGWALYLHLQVGAQAAGLIKDGILPNHEVWIHILDASTSGSVAASGLFGKVSASVPDYINALAKLLMLCVMVLVSIFWDGTCNSVHQGLRENIKGVISYQLRTSQNSALSFAGHEILIV